MLHHTGAWEQAFAEAVRVLKPGGLLLGYDLVGSAPWRMLHRMEGAAYRLIRVDELRAVFDDLPVHDVEIRRGLGGQVVRFTARKT
jgi:SAM-dependent methyltransferase